MKRTKNKNKGKDATQLIQRYQQLQAIERALVANSTIPLEGNLIQRQNAFSSVLGQQQYGGDRDIYQALGYESNPTFSTYYNRYRRQTIARAVIDRPVRATWRGNINVIESDDKDETELEKGWKELNNKFKVKNKLIRLDKLTGIGVYGVLLFGLSDVKTPDDWKKPAPKSNTELRYLKPYSSNSATIYKYESDPQNERYGLPLYYQVKLSNADGYKNNTIIHYSRVLHVVDEPLESEIEGAPRLEVILNRLFDLDKIVGGDGEMFWRGARPGYQGKVDQDYKVTTATFNDMQDQLDEYENNLRRILLNKGIELHALEQQISDPSNHVDVQIALISAAKQMPKRILMGSERGELASSQDRQEWLDNIKDRRLDFAEPVILRPFVDRCIEFGVLPKYKDSYNIDWEDLYAPSAKDKADVSKLLAEALSKYAATPGMESVIPFEAFMKEVMFFSDEQIELIGEMRKAVDIEEPPVTREEEDIIEETGTE